MNRKLKSGIVVTAAILSFVIPLAYVCILLNPSLLFSHHAVYENISLHSNETVTIDTIMEKSLLKIRQSRFYPDRFRPDIYFCDSYRLYSFLAPASSGSFGVHYPLTGNIILSKTDFQKGLVVRNGESNPIRTIESVITHEMTHYLIESEFGFWKTRFMPEWKEEGFCEYIAGASSFDVREGMRLFTANQNDPSASYRYFKYRLYVTYLIQKKGLSFHQIVNGSIDTEELESDIREQIRSSVFSFSD